jgi:hypothetical protein
MHIAFVLINTFNLKALKDGGKLDLNHKSTGKPGNHSYSVDVKANVIDLAIYKFPGAGPTLLKDLLKEQENIIISAQTLRRWMIDAV